MQISFFHLFAGVAIAVILSAALAQIYFENYSQQGANAQPVEREDWLSSRSAKEVDYGGEDAVWVGLSGNMPNLRQEGNVQTYIYGRAPPRKVILAKGKWAGAKSYDEFGEALKEEAKRLGWSFEEMPVSQITGADYGRIIVMPSGAWPKALENVSDIAGEKDLLIYIGVRENVSLLEDGSLVRGGADGRINGGNKISGLQIGEAYEVYFENARAWIVPKTLDEQEDSAQFANAILEDGARSESSGLLARASKNFSKKYSQVILLKKNAPQMWARIIVGSNGRIVKIWDEKVEKNNGKLDGPAEASRGKSASFQAIIWPQYPQQETISYSAALYDEEGKKRQAMDIGGANISANSENESAAWVGAFIFSQWPEGEVALVQVEDQFSRVYARAAVDIAGYEIVPVWEQGLEKKYLITKDGEPAGISNVKVQKKGSAAWADLPVYGGIVKVNSEWESGENALIFDTGGAVLEYEWNEGGGQWEFFAKVGMPVLAALVLLHIAISSSRKKVYTICVPETIRYGQMEMHVSRKMLLELAANVAHISRIAQSLQKKWELDEKSAISIESLKNAMAQLCKEGSMREYNEYYVDAKKMGDGEFVARALELILKDRLLGLGIGLHSYGTGHRDSRHKIWVVWREGLLERMAGKNGMRADYILFPSKTCQEQFEQQLALRGDAGACRIKLALELSRLKFVQPESIAGAANAHHING
jgi:hypothetical protein